MAELLRCHDDIGWNVLQREAAGADGNAPFDLAHAARFFAGGVPDSYTHAAKRSRAAATACTAATA